jgi:hypothetical protein
VVAGGVSLGCSIGGRLSAMGILWCNSRHDVLPAVYDGRVGGAFGHASHGVAHQYTQTYTDTQRNKNPDGAFCTNVWEKNEACS